MIDRMIDTALMIREDEKRSFVLAGICIAADTIIMLDRQMERIGGILTMTRVGRMFQERFDNLEAQLNESKAQLNESKAQLEECNSQIERLLKERESVIVNLLRDGSTHEKKHSLTGAGLGEISRIEENIAVSST